MSDRKMINAFMAGLIKRAGGVDAVAAIITAATGEPTSKGSISKRLSGQLDWSAVDIWALEDALGDPCVSRWRIQNRTKTEEDDSFASATVAAVRESSEATTAIMEATFDRGCWTKARKELSESIAASQRVLSLIEGGKA